MLQVHVSLRTCGFKSRSEHSTRYASAERLRRDSRRSQIELITPQTRSVATLLDSLLRILVCPVRQML